MHRIAVGSVFALAGYAAHGFAQAPSPLSVTVSTVVTSHDLPSTGRLGGVTVDAKGRLYVANFREAAWRVDLDGTVTALAMELQGSSGNAIAPEIEEIEIRVGDMTFDALAAGPADGELVLLLHGFPQTGHSYRHQIRALAAAGFRAVAPDQRGYSPGARPLEVSAYATTHLVADVIGMVDALGRDRFHLVGHDWGGAVAWITATAHAPRVQTLTVLSTPHFNALGAGLADATSEQAQRSSYFDVFAKPGAEHQFLENDKAFFRGIFQGSGIAKADVDVYLNRLGSPEAMRAALNWYSALVASRSTSGSSASPPAPPIRVPTLYIFGTEDPAFSRESADATEQFVAGPYDYHVLDGMGHWLLEQAADEVTALLVEHVRQSRG